MPDSLDIENLSLWIFHVCPETGFLRRWKPSENMRFYGCSPPFQDMFGEGFPLFADSLDASGCKAVMPKLPIRRPGRPTLKVVEGQCQQCFILKEAHLKPSMTLRDSSVFVGGTDLETRKSKLGARHCSPSLRGDVGLGVLLGWHVSHKIIILR